MKITSHRGPEWECLLWHTILTPSPTLVSAWLCPSHPTPLPRKRTHPKSLPLLNTLLQRHWLSWAWPEACPTWRYQGEGVFLKLPTRAMPVIPLTLFQNLAPHKHNTDTFLLAVLWIAGPTIKKQNPSFLGDLFHVKYSLSLTESKEIQF